jgi:hypothetical protein
VSNELNRSQNVFNSETGSSDNLWQYVQGLAPETIAQYYRVTGKSALRTFRRYRQHQ